MRCLHPLAARDAVRSGLTEQMAAAERNRDPSGLGWTAMHVVASPAIDFSNLVDIAALREALSPLMPEVTRFHATAGAGFSGHDAWGSYDEAAVCYGLDETCFVKVDLDEGRVRAIWFECRRCDVARRELLGRALKAIDALTPCVLADHWLAVEVVVGDDRLMQNYFDALAPLA